MLFLALNKVNPNFAKWEFTWRSYHTAEIPATTKQVNIVDQKEFMAAALDSDKEAFVFYVASFLSKKTVYPTQKA